MAVKLAVFDIAGTTLADDNAVAVAFNKAFELYGYHLPSGIVNPLMGYKKTVAIQMIFDQLKIEADKELIDSIHEAFVDEMLDYYAFSPDVRVMPGAEEVMWSLKEQGIRIALNTGFPREIADAIVDRMQWVEMGLVDDYIASDEVENGRPDPSMINRLMERAGITDPKEVIKIGDTEVDVNEGRNAGCSVVIAVTTGAFSREQLEPYHPDYILNDLSELSALIVSHA